MANKFQAKRTTVSGRLPNTTNSSNASYIDAGEFAINLTDKKLVSSNGSLTFEIGANLSVLNVSGNVTISGVIVANGGTGSAGHVLKSTGSGTMYWDGTNVIFQGPTVPRTFTLPDANASIAVTGNNSFTGDQNLQDNSLIRAILKDCAGAFYDAGDVTGLDYVNGSLQRWSPTGTKTLAITNWPASGSVGELIIEGVNLAAASLTWPTAINWVKKDGTFTTSISTYLSDISTTLQSSGTDYVLLWTRDSGTTIRGKLIR